MYAFLIVLEIFILSAKPTSLTPPQKFVIRIVDERVYSRELCVQTADGIIAYTRARLPKAVIMAEATCSMTEIRPI